MLSNMPSSKRQSVNTFLNEVSLHNRNDVNSLTNVDCTQDKSKECTRIKTNEYLHSLFFILYRPQSFTLCIIEWCVIICGFIYLLYIFIQTFHTRKRNFMYCLTRLINNIELNCFELMKKQLMEIVFYEQFSKTKSTASVLK